MTTTKDQLDAMREVHGSDTTDEALVEHVHHLLSEADRIDDEARRARKRAGLLLLQLRDKHPRDWKRRAGITPEVAEQLISMVTIER